MQKIIQFNQAMRSFVETNELMQTSIFGNKVFVILIGVFIFFLSLVVLKIFQTIIIARLRKMAEKTKNRLDDVLIDAILGINWPFYVFTSFYVALQFLQIHKAIKTGVFFIFLIAVVYYAIKFFNSLIDYGAEIVIKNRMKEDERADFTIIKLISSVSKISLWAGAIILILANMGYNVSSLVAGLGIGGIAVALALQNILGDLFSSLAIYFDKPFRVGDFVVVGEQMGTVMKVGVKTTRIQVPQGEELVVANSELSKAPIRNFGTMEKRRGLFTLGVAYETPHAKLKKIPEMIKKIIEEAEEKTEVNRVHFKEFGDSALIYEIVYYVNSSDYQEFLDILQSINLNILEKFEKEKIEIAYPTQTVYLKK